MVRPVLWLQLTVARSERELSFYSNPAKFLKFLKSNPIKSLKFVVHRTVDKCFSHLYGYIHWEKNTRCTSLTQIYFNHQRNCIQQWWCSMETLRWHISNATSIAYSTLAEDCLWTSCVRLHCLPTQTALSEQLSFQIQWHIPKSLFLTITMCPNVE